MNYRNLLQRLDAPLKRVGFVLVSVAVFLWVAAAIHWNFDYKPFFYTELHTKITKVPAPPDVDGFSWREETHGWGMYRIDCLNEAKQKGGFFFSSPPESCREKFVSHKQDFYTQWKETFSYFIETLFERRRGGYFLVNVLALGCFIGGGLMLSGALQRALQWIKTGS